ncbi:MAG: Uma2 family endonuclease [Planctomycetota bacterium]|nr:Uma2 family endonuclease [Planctomycetota bacterium]
MNTAIKITYAEYRTLPETGPRYQLIEGDLVMSPAPSFRHQDLVGTLFAALHGFVTARGLGKAIVSPVDVILNDENVPQPDIVFLPTSQKNLIAPEGIRGGPALCVEVLSPRTAELDLGVKRLLYAKHGVEEYWVVSPEARTVAVYRLQEDARAPLRILGLRDTLTTTLLPGWALPLEPLFAG